MNNEDSRYVLTIDHGTWYEESHYSDTLEALEYDYHEATRSLRHATIYDRDTDEFIEL